MCVCVYIYIYIHVCIYTQTYLHMYVHMVRGVANNTFIFLRVAQERDETVETPPFASQPAPQATPLVMQRLLADGQAVTTRSSPPSRWRGGSYPPSRPGAKGGGARNALYTIS